MVVVCMVVVCNFACWAFQVRRRNAAGHVYDHAWQMQRPGAVSHARFMAKAIYLMKIYMTRHQLPPAVLTNDERPQVERIAPFVFFIYGKYYLQTMLPAAAPRLDMEFWTDVHRFQVLLCRAVNVLASFHCFLFVFDLFSRNIWCGIFIQNMVCLVIFHIPLFLGTGSSTHSKCSDFHRQTPMVPLRGTRPPCLV